MCPLFLPLIVLAVMVVLGIAEAALTRKLNARS